MTDQDLQRRIEEAFGDGPPQRPVDERIRAGHSALLRRRIGVGAAALATVAVLGSGFALTQGGDDSKAEDTPVATDPTTSEDEQKGDPEKFDSDKRWNKPLVRYDGEGVMQLSDPDIEILEQVDDPVTGKKFIDSVGLEVALDGGRQWILLTRSKDGDTASFDAPRPNYPQFQDWLDDQIALELDLKPKKYVSFGPDGALVPAEGVELLEERQVDVGERFAPPGNGRFAQVRDATGQEWFILARNVGGGPEFFPNKAGGKISTPSRFLKMAKQQYADGGEGLR